MIELDEDMEIVIRAESKLMYRYTVTLINAGEELKYVKACTIQYGLDEIEIYLNTRVK